MGATTAPQAEFVDAGKPVAQPFYIVDVNGNTLAFSTIAGNVNLNQVGGAAVALGQTTMSASMPVVLASNQGATPFNVLYNPVSGAYEGQRTPTVFKSIKALAITAGTAQAVWTPTTGKKFRLLGYEFSIVGAGSSAAIFEDGSGGSSVEFLRTYLVNSSSQIDTPAGFGNGYLSTTANNPLYLDVTTSGSITGFVFGTEE